MDINQFNQVIESNDLDTLTWGVSNCYHQARSIEDDIKILQRKLATVKGRKRKFTQKIQLIDLANKAKSWIYWHHPGRKVRTQYSAQYQPREQ